MALKSLYTVNYKTSSALTMLGFAADVLAIPAILRSKPTITLQQLMGIDSNSIHRYNQFALRQQTHKREHYQKISDDLLRISIALVGLLFLSKKARQSIWQILMLYAETHALAYTIYSYSPLGPAFRNKYRPVVYYNLLPEDLRNPGNNNNSLYSGHTGNAACASFFMAKVYNDLHPRKSNWLKGLFYAAATLPPLLVGYFRIKALKHFPSDVLVATLIGATCGILTPELHKRN